MDFTRSAIIFCLIFLTAKCWAKQYEVIHTETKNLYPNHQTSYHPVYKLKTAKEFIYKTIPVYVDANPIEQSHVKVIDSVKTPAVKIVETPEADYDDSLYYSHAYTIAKPVPTLATTYGTLSAGESDVYHLSNEDNKKYKYGYRISDPHTGSEFGHSEVNDGHTAKGYYHVLLPDGRLQNVKYWAGASGYNAVVTYDH